VAPPGAAYNILLNQVRANLGQRAAEKTCDITGADLTPVMSWHRFGLEKLLRANREQWLPWHEQVRTWPCPSASTPAPPAV
jgi:hypothetical protein